MFAPRTSDMCPDISFSSTVKHKSSDAFTNVEMGWRFPENAYRGQNRSSAGRNGEQHQPLSQRRNRSTFPNHTTWKVDRACHGSQQCKLRTCHAGCQRLDRHPNSKSTRSCLSISASRALGRLEEHRLRREETQRRNHRIVGIRGEFISIWYHPTVLEIVPCIIDAKMGEYGAYQVALSTTGIGAVDKF